jgi:hypothetical protein
VITESAPLGSPVWEYERNKIACELRLNLAYREQGPDHGRGCRRGCAPGAHRRSLAWFEESPQRMKSSGEGDRLLDRLIAAYGHS